MNNNQLLSRAALGALLLTAICSGADARQAPADEAVLRVHDRIAAADCEGAVSRLNDGLAKGYPEVQLLAGSMYDEGVCVKRNWERAVHFYVLAHDAGQRAAAPRLAAGYAAPENGPDIAAALWWSARDRNGIHLSMCTAGKEAGDDPDRFVAVLHTWPQSRLAACNYMVGVWMTLIGEINYPSKQLSYALSGTVRVEFDPSVPRIDVQTTETEAGNLYGVFSGDTMSDRKSSSSKRGFEEALRKVGDRALKRYPQPAGIDSDWRRQMQFVFKLNY